MTGPSRRMRSSDIAIKLDADQGERRSHPRRNGPFPIEDLSCSSGSILDVSMTGIRLLLRWPLSDSYELTISHRDLEAKLNGRVKWSRRISVFCWEVGLEFVEPSIEDRALLSVAIDR